MAYTTLELVKEYLGISDDTVTDDDLLEDIILRATEIINKETGQKFEPYTATKEYGYQCVDRYNLPRVLELDEYLQTITTLTNGDGTVIPSTDYTLQPKNKSAYSKIVLKSNAAGWTFDDMYDSFISINGTWGLYPTVPKDVEHYTIRLVAYLYKQKDNHQDLDRTLIAGNATILPQSMPNDIIGFFKRYRKVF